MQVCNGVRWGDNQRIPFGGAGSDALAGDLGPMLSLPPTDRVWSMTASPSPSPGGLESDLSRVRHKLRKFLQRRPTLQSLRDKGYIKGTCNSPGSGLRWHGAGRR